MSSFGRFLRLGIVALFSVVAAQAQVFYSITGQLSLISGTDLAGLDGRNVQLMANPLQSGTPTTNAASSTLTLSNVFGLVFRLDGFPPLGCDANQVVITDNVSGADTMSISNCSLPPVGNFSGSFSFTQGGLYTAVPAAFEAPPSSTTGTVTAVIFGQAAVFSVVNASATATGTPPPSIVPNPVSWNPTYELGTTANLSQEIALISSGAPVSYAVSSNAPWLSVSPAAGNTTTGLQLTADPTGLAPGVYNGVVTVASYMSLEIPVTLSVGAPVFQPSPVGCAMVHCDGQMSDRSRLPPPLGPTVTVIAHDTLSTGSGNPFGPPGSPNQGNGCAGNGRTAVCAYSTATGDNVVAYSASGQRLWTSGNLLNQTAFASVPMISQTGGVIAADDTRLIRFSASGSVIWNTLTPGGTPISPIPGPSGSIILATRNGPISAYNGSTGTLIGSIYVKKNPGDTAFFDTQNTPCIVGNRIYAAMELADGQHTARLVALDFNPANLSEPFTVAWYFEYGGPTYASPTCVGNTVFFDGGSVHPGEPQNPQIFAVHDDGAQGSQLWVKPTLFQTPASFALDPRGGLWAEFIGSPHLQRRNLATGAIMETINVATLVGDPVPNMPWSVVSMAGTLAQPVLMIGTLGAINTNSYVIAIDLNTRSPLWKLNLAPSMGTDNASVQFPVIYNAQNKAVLVFCGRTSGAYFVTTP